MRARSPSFPVMPVILLLATVYGPALAADAAGTDDAAGLCPADIEPPARMREIWAQAEARELAGGTAEPADSVPVAAEADRVELVREDVSRLEGDVWLQQGERFISSEALEFDAGSGVIRSLAPARFGNRQLIVDAETVVYDTRIGQGLFEGVEFHLPRRGARGEADVFARTGETTARLDGVKYTTCPADDEDWWLKASRLDLDHEEGFGTGRNVRIAFMGVPFFYMPWISFPIDERRKTGFLFPEFGDSGRNGPWLRVPYYFNLAPNYDATLVPYYMQDRGTRLDGEFRYLSGWGGGTLAAEYLDEDRLADAHRYYYSLQHLSRLPADWQLRVSFQQVSDEEYVQDFSESGSATLTSHLPQTMSLTNTGLEYGANLRVLRYQTVDPTIPEAQRPYEQWPTFNYYYSPLPLWDRLWLELDGTSVNFRRDDRIEGWRQHARTALSADFGNPGLLLTPRLAWWHSEYDMTQTDGTTLDIARALPVGSLDLAARFARPLASGGSQTLEPRLFYLYVPYRDQNDIPLFDTREVSDTITRLFRENRFTGPDRVGDENRATLGLGTGLVDADGREWFDATIARAWYFDDRRVTLQPTEPPATERVSDYYAGVEYRPSETQNLRLDLSWDPDEDKVGFGSVQYQFNPAERAVLNLAYRFRRDATPGSTSTLPAIPLKQVDFSFAAPVGGRWRLFGRAVYSLEEEHSQETLAGFEYENCCWAFRAFNRRYIFNREGEFDQSLWFQLELKGLSSVGRKVDEFLADDIYGYGETP